VGESQKEHNWTLLVCLHSKWTSDYVVILYKHGYPFQACNKATPKKWDGLYANVSEDQGWLSSVDDHISLISLGLGVGIVFGGVVTLIIMWDGTSKDKTIYGVYRFPK